MKKPISPTVHGVLDYSTAAAVAMAPRLMQAPPAATRLFDTVAASYTGLSAMTDYPLSVKRVVPFKGHGAAELAIGVALPFLPWALGFQDHKPARNFCFALAGITFVVAALTDWNGESEKRAALS